MKAKIYNQEGKETGEQELNPDIFGLKVKSELIHQAMVAQLANLRQPWAHVKTKGEVSGGGKKPWKQKGTGRARAGSIRSPLWRGGGAIFGPRKEKNYKQKVNKKVRKQALLMCLSDKVNTHKLILVDKLELPEIKTKKMAEILEKLPSKKNKTLIILNKDNKNVIQSSKNIPFVKSVFANNLNIMDLLNYKYVLLPLKGLELLEKTYLPKK
ncbi:MAG: LSU ribosomal protein L4P [Parcubacteria group bacterium Athens1014_10]|nr:MAG: LSU ribosomal protein L4P [Parcubacteria group bacterium Athens1014_10]TSD05498.1 MAG: LSU ribosomal protein L4P [Parcubacteria group bacterium Athens0714_12]